MSLISLILRKIDKFVEPPINYCSYSYVMQIKARWFFLKGRHLLASVAHLLKLVLMIGISLIASPLCWVVRLAGFRFVSIDLAQIGSVMWLDLFFRENKLEMQTPKWKIFVTRSKYTDANRFALDLYDPYVTYISNPVLKLLLSPFFTNPFFQDDISRFEPTVTFLSPVDEARSVAHSVYQRFMDANGAPLVQLSEADVARGKQAVSSLVPPGRPFVALHVREPGFYGDASRVIRNADIRTYEKAIKFLIERGCNVVRMGDPAMSPIDDMIKRCGPNLTDYAHSGARSDFLDCYLVSQCAFFFGGSSGLAFLPYILQVNSCNVNFYNTSIALGFFEGDLVSPKKFRMLADDSLLPFDRAVRRPFTQNLQTPQLEEFGVYSDDNSDDEILETVKEFVERENYEPTAQQKEANALLPISIYSYGARGQYSDAFLEEYFRTSSSSERPVCPSCD